MTETTTTQSSNKARELRCILDWAIRWGFDEGFLWAQHADYATARHLMRVDDDSPLYDPADPVMTIDELTASLSWQDVIYLQRRVEDSLRDRGIQQVRKIRVTLEDLSQINREGGLPIGEEYVGLAVVDQNIVGIQVWLIEGYSARDHMWSNHEIIGAFADRPEHKTKNSAIRHAKKAGTCGNGATGAKIVDLYESPMKLID